MSMKRLFLAMLILAAGCSSDPTATDGGATDSATSDTGASDTGASDDTGTGGDAGIDDATASDSGTNRFVALCGLPATTDMPDTAPYGPVAYLHYLEMVGGTLESCDVAGGWFGGIPTIRFSFPGGPTPRATFTTDWEVQSVSGGTMVDTSDVDCPDGVDVVITANSLFDARVMTVTIRFDVGANTVSVLAFDIP